MFGCVVAGRLLQTNLQQIDESHAAFELPAAGSINHVCVFLLGTVPFPDGYGAAVHFFWPGKGFQLLGMLSNEKPSAIFRLRGNFTAQTTSTQAAFGNTAQMSAAPGADVTAVLGLSIEPLAQIMQQTNSLPSALSKPAAPPSDPTVVAEKIVKHMFNYISGFVSGNTSSGNITPDSVVPMGLVAKWYESFLTKVKAVGPGFLDRQE
ncbi:DUF775-domain-containing protein [Auriscalpium vulgare]|uniref:DUF775-domain-containing protein n=1 Tax=Auriscalpium vulgare TaxID=40419 RepID=A0ACB8R4Y9_9AGAM|nr:DUF775-domain-containing protein [Auriscalpium vulgare]